MALRLVITVVWVYVEFKRCRQKLKIKTKQRKRLILYKFVIDVFTEIIWARTMLSLVSSQIEDVVDEEEEEKKN